MAELDRKFKIFKGLHCISFLGLTFCIPIISLSLSVPAYAFAPVIAIVAAGVIGLFFIIEATHYFKLEKRTRTRFTNALARYRLFQFILIILLFASPTPIVFIVEMGHIYSPIYALLITYTFTIPPSLIFIVKLMKYPFSDSSGS